MESGRSFSPDDSRSTAPRDVELSRELILSLSDYNPLAMFRTSATVLSVLVRVLEPWILALVLVLVLRMKYLPPREIALLLCIKVLQFYAVSVLKKSAVKRVDGVITRNCVRCTRAPVLRVIWLHAQDC